VNELIYILLGVKSLLNMGLKLLIYVDNDNTTEMDVDDTVLMFFDMLMATLGSVPAVKHDVDFFEYYDEDGDAIAVRTDDELQALLASHDLGEKLKIRLRSSQCSSTMPTLADPMQLAPEDLQLLERLSDGQFGTVYKALDVRHDRYVAVKSICVDGAVNTRTNLLNEIEILKMACSSPFIVEFYAAMFVDNELLICLELMDALSLDRYGKLPPPVLGAVSVAVVSGLEYLWSRNIIHRDIKPSNFLVNTSGDVKLSDFGVSKQMAQSIAWSYVGTKVYMAPERLGGDVYKIHSDVWSLGISLVEMAIGRFPLEGSDGFMSVLSQHAFNVEKEIAFVGNGFVQLINGCLQQIPSQRFRPEDIAKAEFILRHSPMDRFVVSHFIKTSLNLPIVPKLL
jgi:serine/threonine protein kinase